MKSRRSIAVARACRIEHLERRLLLACDVQFADGLLSINCDDGDNRLEIHDSPDAVSVFDDGQPLGAFRGVESIQVHTFGGNDRVEYIAETDPSDANLVANEGFKRDLSVDLGDGNDALDVSVDGRPAGLADIITGAGAGGGPHVKVFDGRTGAEAQSFFAYDQSFAGGVRVAAGDVTGDGVYDLVTGAGPGAGPHVKVFDGLTGAELRSFLAFDPGFLGGVYVAAGDINNDGRADIIVGADAGGGPHVKVFDGRTGTEIRSFFAFDPGFSGGVRVAAGDVNGDATPDIIVGAGPGAGPHVKVFDGRTGTELRSFFAYDRGFLGGVYVAAGDINTDGRADIITGAGAGGGPHVKVFDARSGAELHSFFAYDPSFTGGVRVAAGDVNNDGTPDIITGAGPGAGPHVKVFDGRSGRELRSFFAYDPSFTGGVFVAGGDVVRPPRAPISFHLTVVAGDGDDTISTTATGAPQTSPDVPLGSWILDATMDLGAGNDRLDLDVEGFDQADLTILGGDGNDQSLITVFTRTGSIAAHPVTNLNMDTGNGNDQIRVSIAPSQPPPAGPVPIPYPNVSMNVDTGDGDDVFTADVLDVHILDVQVDAGDGDDAVSVSVGAALTESVGAAQSQSVHIDIDGGAGADRLIADLRTMLPPTDPSRFDVVLRPGVEADGAQCLVFFLGGTAGDPDRPVIVGAVYNAGGAPAGSSPASLHLAVDSAPETLDIEFDLIGTPGNDTVDLSIDIPPTARAESSVSVNIDLGDGNDFLSAQASDVTELGFAIDAGGGDDTVEFRSHHTGGANFLFCDGSVHMGDGNDKLTADFEDISQVVFSADGGAGHDAIDVHGRVKVQFSWDTTADLDVNLGDGNDSLNLHTDNVTELGFAIDAGAGNDTVSSRHTGGINVLLGDGSVHMGDGNDELVAEFADIPQLTFSVDGQAGAHVIWIKARLKQQFPSDTTADLDINLADGNDFLNIDTDGIADLGFAIDMGGGDDTVSVQSHSGGILVGLGDGSVRMGDGNDRLDLTLDYPSSHLLIDAGDGRDQVRITARRRLPRDEPRPDDLSSLEVIARLGPGDDILRLFSDGYRRVMTDIDTGPLGDGRDRITGMLVAPGAKRPIHRIIRRLDGGNDVAVWLTVGFFEVVSETPSQTRQITIVQDL